MKKYTPEELAALNKAELIAILMSDFGAVVKDSEKKDALIERILKLQEGDCGGSSLEADPDADTDDENAIAKGETTPAAKKNYDPEARTYVKIGNDENDTSDVFLDVNGDSCSVKRECWVHLKNKFIKGPLNDAVQTFYKDGKPFEKRRFNVTVWQGQGKPPELSDSDEQTIAPLMD